MMVGRDVLLRVEKDAATPGEPLLEVEDLHALDDRHLERVRGISLTVRAGEIVGIAGVDGNGQTELVEVLSGLAQAHVRPRRRRRARHDRCGRARDHRLRRRPHPGGPPPARPRAGLLARREHRAPRLRQGAELAARLALSESARALGPASAPAVRRSRRRPAYPCCGALGRKPAEGRPRPRDRARPECAARGAADARTGRGGDRVRAPSARRGARPRARPCCSCRSSSRRSSRCRTASS